MKWREVFIIVSFLVLSALIVWLGLSIDMLVKNEVESGAGIAQVVLSAAFALSQAVFLAYQINH